MKSIFHDRNSKKSMKRVAGAFGFINGILMAWAMLVFKLEVNSTLIIGILTASAGLLAATIAEKKNIQEDD